MMNYLRILFLGLFILCFINKNLAQDNESTEYEPSFFSSSSDLEQNQNLSASYPNDSGGGVDVEDPEPLPIDDNVLILNLSAFILAIYYKNGKKYFKK